jgi:hypothetical protein
VDPGLTLGEALRWEIHGEELAFPAERLKDSLLQRRHSKRKIGGS